MGVISERDRQILRGLAGRQMELANCPGMQKLRQEWAQHGAFSRSSRPMILIEAHTFENDYIPPLMRCESDSARKLERELLLGMVNHKLFGDDTVVKDYSPVAPRIFFVPFGIEPQKEYAGNLKSDAGLAHRYVPKIDDLEQDFHMLGKSRYGIDWESMHEEESLKNDVYGDILPVLPIGTCLCCCLTQDLIRIMKMEDMFTAMLDYPELFCRMMEMLADDYLEHYNFLEIEGALLPTAGPRYLLQGSYCYNDELPSIGAGLKTSEIWGYMDSQETSVISPAMFAEFFAPHYRRIAGRFGLLSYGCCEPVDPVWGCLLSDLANLRKVSVSPWANEDAMGEKLRGKRIVYMRKPTSNLLGVGSMLDEQAVTRHIDKTVKAAQGCYLEIIQRDVYRINNTTDKVRRYVQLIRQSCEKHEL